MGRTAAWPGQKLPWRWVEQLGVQRRAVGLGEAVHGLAHCRGSGFQVIVLSAGQDSVA